MWIHRWGQVSPIDRVVALFESSKHLDKWQDGFVSLEHLSGTPGEPGAQTRFIYRIGKREIELIETIRIKDLPNIFEGLYEAEAMTNVMTNRFIALDKAQTRREATIELHALQPIDSPANGLALARNVQKADTEMVGSVQDIR